MHLRASLLGAVGGLLLASIPGALLGAVVGQLIDKKRQLPALFELSRLKKKLGPDGFELLFMLLGRIAKLDGQVLPAHIEQARFEMSRLNLDQSQRQQAIAAFNLGKNQQQGWRLPLLRQRGRTEQNEDWLRACWNMAQAAGSVHEREVEQIRLWGRWMGCSAATLERLAGEFEQRRPPVAQPAGSYQNALTLLGVHSASPPEDIKQAYRRLLSRHHPDKLAGRGASPAELRAAAERTRQLQEAYQRIRERHGFR